MPKRKDQNDHDSMVRALTNYLKLLQYTDIRADLPGFTRPVELAWEDRQDGHVPDVSALKQETEHIFEVETSDSISHTHTEDQWHLFASNAERNNKAFCVIVPKQSKEDARGRLKELGLENVRVWTLK